MRDRQRITAVVITTYSVAREILDRCVRAVLVDGDADLVIVVDNGGRAELAPDLLERVELIRAGHNGGFGAAANLGIRRAVVAGADAIAILNDDVEVEPGWLVALHAALAADASVGVVQPKLLVTATDPPLVNSVGVMLDRFGAGVDIGHGRPDAAMFSGPSTIDLFTGGAVLFDAAFLADVGGFDERLFMYYEDVDLARRGAERGWVYHCEPASRVWHQGGMSSGAAGAQMRFYLERNRLWCLFRFAPPRMVLAGVWLSLRRLRWPPRREHARALVAGLGGAGRRLRERSAARR